MTIFKHGKQQFKQKYSPINQARKLYRIASKTK